MKIRNRDLLSAADALDRASSLIIEKGWAQGAFAINEAGEEVDPQADDACGFCAVGAIARVNKLKMDPDKGDDSYGPPENTPSDLLAHYVGVFSDKNGLTTWNDEPDQTGDSVVKAMRDCAAMARTRWAGLSWWQRAFGTLN